MSVNAILTASLVFKQFGVADFSNQRFDGLVSTVMEVANGTGVQQADLLFVDERTVAASSNDDLDLAGVLSQTIGGVLNAAKIVAILLINRPILDSAAANVSSLTLGGGTNPVVAVSSGVAIGPNGFLFLCDPDAIGIAAVTPATGDILRVANGAGGPATYQIAILARSV